MERERAGVAILTTDKIDFKIKAIIRDKEEYFIYNSQDREAT